MAEEEDELIQALYAIDASSCDYGEWVQVGMALHTAGFDWRDWDDWSRTDYARYHEGDCEEKWQTFVDGLGEDGISDKYIFRLAYDYGWEGPEREDVENRAFGWDESISTSDTVEHKSTATLPAIPEMSQREQMEAQLSAMFDDNELVNVAIRTQQDDQKAWDKGFYANPGGIANMVAQIDIDPTCGACVCVNPLRSSTNRKIENLAAFRLGLFESDEDDPDEFRKVTRLLDLPVVCEVWSGNRSVHTIVRLDAQNRREYKKRWKMVADAYEEHGITMDRVCSAPNKMCRLAGCDRGNDTQRLLSGPFGPASFEAWLRRNEKPLLPAWDAPDIDEEIETDPELVQGIIRFGEVGLITARAKRGKSWLMMQLAVCIASGLPFLHHKCREGKVLYIDPELKRKTARKRLQEVARAMGVDDSTVNKNIKLWSLRGVLTSEGNVADVSALVHDIELSGERFDLVVLDSCSAFLGDGADENDNASIRRFITGSVSRIAKATGGAVIMVHHEGKGATGDREAEDRARGAGAWVDCPDVIMQLSSIYPPTGTPDQYLAQNEYARRLVCVAIRDNPEFEPINLIFKKPTYSDDHSGMLDDWKVMTSASLGGKRTGEKRKAAADERAESLLKPILQHLVSEHKQSIPASEAAKLLGEYFGETPATTTLKRYVERFDGLDVVQTGERRWSIGLTNNIKTLDRLC